VPALHRAPQAIIVGDRQQLPATAFFVSDAADDDDAPAAEPTHDSLLTQAAVTLPGTMLGWHYRSRSEALIAFSNAQFYGGRLLTVPDVAAPAGGVLPPCASDDGDARAAAVLDRPVSFHRLAAAPYHQRRNAGEAAYIARLVRGLLAAGTGYSLGVVAFSLAQQDEIERAIDALAESDPDFRARYDAETQREADGQWCGLFVKNLENVQGDERDLIILSCCYGPDRKGRMAMHFGPINQAGGEKRLNVVFSRARRHLALVASITADAITNDATPGAATLKRYLAYAAALSSGDADGAARVLASATPEPVAPDAPLVSALAAALTAAGWEVAAGVGRSRLRCDLAVRRSGETRWRLGIRIDHDGDWQAQSAWERDLARPGAFAAAGWRIERVLAQEWCDDRAGVLARLSAALG
jgi:hypothetical protein